MSADAPGHDDGHAHGHVHFHAAPPREYAKFSLLRMSVAQRLALAGIVVAAIWSGVKWALA